MRDRVVQLALYFIETRELALVFRPSPGQTPGPRNTVAFEHWNVSSALNAGPGLSWGGGCTGVAGSGLVAWKSYAPKKPADSSGGAELIAATYQNKFGQGTRMFAKECRLGALMPWRFNIDAKSTIDGVQMERVSDSMLYVAARYAMLRYSEDETKDILITKCTSSDNTAGSFTKPLIDADLARSRAQMLGHDVPGA